jgi:hypothetical protein
LNQSTRTLFSDILKEYSLDRAVTLAIDLNPLTV